MTTEVQSVLTSAQTEVSPPIASPPPPTLTPAQIDAVTKPLVDDAIQTEKTIAAIVAAYRSHGVEGVGALLPAIYQTEQQDQKDIETAIPVVKVGYKTTEFWVVVGIAAVDLYFGVTGKETPTTVTEILTALGAAYGISRGITKKA